MSNQFFTPKIKIRFYDNNGVPLANGRIMTLNPPNTNWKESWEDNSKVVKYTGPSIPLDSNGEVSLYLEGNYTIRVVSYDWFFDETYENLDAINTSFIRHQPNTSGDCDRYLQGKLEDVISVLDFGAVRYFDDLPSNPDDIINNSPFFQAAFDYLEKRGGGTIIIPPGEYYFHPATAGGVNDIVIKSSNTTVILDGCTLYKRNASYMFQVGDPDRVVSDLGIYDEYKNIHIVGNGKISQTEENIPSPNPGGGIVIGGDDTHQYTYRNIIIDGLTIDGMGQFGIAGGGGKIPNPLIEEGYCPMHDIKIINTNVTRTGGNWYRPITCPNPPPGNEYWIDKEGKDPQGDDLWRDKSKAGGAVNFLPKRGSTNFLYQNCYFEVLYSTYAYKGCAPPPPDPPFPSSPPPRPLVPPTTPPADGTTIYGYTAALKVTNVEGALVNNVILKGGTEEVISIGTGCDKLEFSDSVVINPSGPLPNVAGTADGAFNAGSCIALASLREQDSPTQPTKIGFVSLSNIQIINNKGETEAKTSHRIGIFFGGRLLGKGSIDNLHTPLKISQANPYDPVPGDISPDNSGIVKGWTFSNIHFQIDDIHSAQPIHFEQDRTAIGSNPYRFGPASVMNCRFDSITIGGNVGGRIRVLGSYSNIFKNICTLNSPTQGYWIEGPLNKIINPFISFISPGSSYSGIQLIGIQNQVLGADIAISGVSTPSIRIGDSDHKTGNYANEIINPSFLSGEINLDYSTDAKLHLPWVQTISYPAADITLEQYENGSTIVFDNILPGNVNVSLPDELLSQTGQKFRIVRSNPAGSSNDLYILADDLSIIVNTQEWADIQFTGSNWVCVSKGVLT